MQWIRVEDELPQYGEPVITFDRRAAGVFCGRRTHTDGDGEHWERGDGWGSNSGQTYSPTHWMPFPPPPSED